jgi:2-iminobutanoate/2-iminopropanoate deaminase
VKRPITSHSAPRAIGPYSQAIAVPPGEMVFCSGQVGLDPATMKLTGGGLEAEVRCALENLRCVLGAAGLSLEHVVRTTCYLTSMDDFAAMNRIYAEFFARGAKPARSTVAVAALPAGAAFEIDAIAVRPETGDRHALP